VSTNMRWAIVATLGLMAAGCATAPLERSGSLASYDNLTTSDGLLTKSQVRVSRTDVLGARSARIEPTAFAVAAVIEPFSDEQRSLIANAVNRELCFALSERFQIAAPMETADLSVRAVITHIAPTDAVAAGVSVVTNVVPSVVAPGVPIPPCRGFRSGSVACRSRRRLVIAAAAKRLPWSGRAERIPLPALRACRAMGMLMISPLHSETISGNCL
jgi:Protein of unknown function (DUF3313)